MEPPRFSCDVRRIANRLRIAESRIGVTRPSIVIRRERRKVYGSGEAVTICDHLAGKIGLKY